MSPIEWVALALGCAVMAAGGLALTAWLIWLAIEMVLRLTRTSGLVLQWYWDGLRSGRLKPPRGT